MKQPDTVSRLLDRVEPPAPPTELEGRSLAAARTAMARPAARTDIWTRLWESRTARFAWAAALAALVLGHVILSVPAREGTARPGAHLYLAGNVLDPELAEATELPRLRSGHLPQLDTTIVPRPAAPADQTPERRPNHDA
jgi:hypothetical protein